MTVAYGGAIYATLPAAQLGLAVTRRLRDLIALGREIKWALNDAEHAVHPADPRLNGIYGTIWFDELGDAGGQVHQRNVTIFADGEVDRSPCGSGTCARLAVLAAAAASPRRARVAARVHRRQHGFTGTVLGTVDVGGRPAVIPRSPEWRTAPASTCSRSTPRPAGPRVRAAMSAPFVPGDPGLTPLPIRIMRHVKWQDVRWR